MLDATARVRTEEPEPGAGIVDGLKLAVTPVGTPEALRLTAESKPLKTAVVIFEVPLLPWTTETEEGEAEMLKLGAGGPVSAVINAACGLPHPVTRS